MPEGPEIAHIADYITEKCKGRKLKDVAILRGRYLKHGAPEHFKEFTEALPLKLLDVQKKGKVLFLNFENGWHIISKLGLTGWWYVSGDMPKWRTFTPNVEFSFQGRALIFSDLLSYGTLTFTRDESVINKELKRLAPDVTGVEFKAMKERLAVLSKRPRWPTTALEEALVDQGYLVSGIGNYLKSEILYTAKISPLRTVDQITEAEWKRILHSAKKTINEMTKAMGGKEEKYMNTMKIYQKKVDPRGNPVLKYRNSMGRTTYWVPQVQN